MDIIILCAGRINFTHLPISTNTSNSMIAVNGRPVIAWILNDLLTKGQERVIIVYREEDTHLRDFLERVYAHQLQIQFAALEESHSILESLAFGLSYCTAPNVGVVLGDTLITDSFRGDQDFVYVHEVEEFHRWCLVTNDEDGQVIGYRDKWLEAPERPYLALCGYYYFTDTTLLQSLVHQALQEGKTQLSQLLQLYQGVHPIQAVIASQWYDFGNIDNLLHSKQRLLQSRYFNTLTIDPVLNTITKVSEFDEKLENELRWYEDLPPTLQVLTPRIVSKERFNGQLHLVQEYYGYPTLAELFLYADLPAVEWRGIARKIIEIHDQFKRYPQEISSMDCQQIYQHKTLERLMILEESSPYWRALLAQPAIKINGKEYANWPSLKEKVSARANAISTGVEGAIIHGDYCFSNILFDFNNQIVRLIDPRGSFGKVGISGDPRYDMAKLRHSSAGLYDYIVSDLFELIEAENAFYYRVFAAPQQAKITLLFDEAIQDAGYNLMEIQFIEALLFMSMLPLHQDKPTRQKAMYLTGIQMLSEIFPTHAHCN